MKLYFVRHATASSKARWSQDDELRPLTRAGRQRFSVAATSLVEARALQVDAIVTSPLVRARQTADILGKTLSDKVPIVEDARLGHEFDVAALEAVLAEHRGARSIAIVGHNPSFAAVLSEVVGGAVLDVRKGSVALVELEDASRAKGRLLWLAPPTIFPGCP
ncbi:MAG TPA: phosphohistidine phosphatase SixA [Coriobacteriia bacterium]